ncbi:NAD dependent epimerase/dehydratase [Purpureocillium lavendulum]|uniref:NAD dependent epimerase/dehydratase n=1 Tax=Purpureocillium lavendulum TaxID=1247861 RepID=A0AB34G396_9HYPO|nr:NAD dependent epimerase/dehydratase [Purpureocillium lavendulum]
MQVEASRRLNTFTLSESFVAGVAHALNSAQVSCVLWGHCLLRVHGVPTIVGSLDFVVPDCELTAAQASLRGHEALQFCREDESCPDFPVVRLHPPPAYHFHIESSEVPLNIFPQSEVLWFLPPFGSSLLPTEAGLLPPQYLLSTDQASLPPRDRPGRGSGVFAHPEDAVVVLKSHVLLEAYMRLFARDSGKQIGSYSMAMVDYMELYVDEDGFLDVDLLPEPLRTFYKDLKEGDKSVRQWRWDLREALGVPQVPSEPMSAWYAQSGKQ